MKNYKKIKFIFAIFASILLFSCAKSSKNNVDFDFSTLKKSNKVNNINSNKDNYKGDSDDQSFISELVPFETREKIQSKVKYGKKNPFSKGVFKLNKLNSSLKLTGIINTQNNKFALVNFLDKRGAIVEDSIGGTNTNLLPIGAKVINIDPKKMQLIINYENENFIFKIQDD